MAVHYHKNKFNSGEWSPLLIDRTDLEDYPAACRVMKNGYPRAHGPFVRRSGFRFVTEVKFSAQDTLLVPFQFSTTQAYVLELGNLYMRVYKDRGYVTDETDEIETASATNPVVIGVSNHSFNNGDQVKIDNVLGMTELNAREFTVANKALHTFELPGVDGTAYTPYISGGTIKQPYEVATPWTDSEVNQLRFVQSADTMYVLYHNRRAYKITRTGDAAWTITAVNFNGPFGPENVEATTFTPAATTGTGIAVVASAVTGINDDTGFQSTDVGRQISIKEGTVIGTAYILSRVDATNITVQILNDFATTDPQTTWRLGTFSGDRGFATKITFHEQRLVIANSKLFPESYWFSQVDDYENFNISATLVDSDGGSYSMVGSEVNVIQFLSSAKSLLVGTTGAEWTVKGSGVVGITPLVVPSQERDSSNGSDDIEPLLIDNTVVYTQFLGNSVYSASFTQDSEGYSSEDISLKAEHLFNIYTILDWSYQKVPLSTIWAVRSDGALLGGSYVRGNNVIGWHYHDTQGDFKRSVSIHGDGRDELWVIVERTIGGEVKKFVEYAEAEFDEDDELKDAFFVDSGLSYNATPLAITETTKTNPVRVKIPGHGLSSNDRIYISEVLGMTELNNNEYRTTYVDADYVVLLDEGGTDIDGTGFTAYISGGIAEENILTVHGFDHLEGKTVSVLADGRAISDKDVTNGAITLQVRARQVNSGLGYDSDVQPLALAWNDQKGSTQGRDMTITGAVVSIYRSIGFKIGNSYDQLFDEGPPQTTWGQPPALFTGKLDIDMMPDPDLDPTICIRQDQPLPLTVTAITAKVTVNRND